MKRPTARLLTPSLLVSCILFFPSSLLAGLTSGLVAWYPFDGDAEDASGNGNHGTVNGAILGTDRHGNSNKAYVFDGSNDFIQIPNHASLNFANSLSLHFWINPNNWAGGGTEGIISKKSNDSSNGYVVYRDNNHLNEITFRYRGDGGFQSYLKTNSFVSDNQWQNWTVTYQETCSKWYKNGQLQQVYDSLSNSSDMSNSNPLKIGYADTWNYFYSGSIDEVRIYDRALTSSEITQLYLLEAPTEQNATLSGTINYSGPVTGPVVIWAKLGALTVNTLTLPNGPGAYTMQLPKNREYDVKAFRDGNGNGNLDAGWQVGEPSAHHGDWNSTSSSFNTLLLDGNKTGIDINVSWHGDNDNDGFYDWDEYVAGSEGNDSTSVPGVGYGLVAHWTFDETNGTVLGDSSGNDVNGTLNGFSSLTNTHWTPGKIGGALRFDGTDDYVSFPGATLLNDLAPMTFAGWVLRETDSDGGYIIAKRSSTTGYWRLNSGNTNLTWVRQFTGTPPSYTSTSPTILDQWTHVAFSWNGYANGANTQLYLDGVQTANPTRANGNGTPVSDSGNLFTIGNRPQNNSSYFKGKLDDFRIWNRVLSPTEVHTLFHGPGFPLTDANFTQAIDLWFSDQATATATYGRIRDWNVTGVTDMSNAFQNRTTFDENITGWDVSNVTDMSWVFSNASVFNQPIGSWNTLNVIRMDQLFYGANSFNQPIGDWNVSKVRQMQDMFRNATDFNQSIIGWDVSNVTAMHNMFQGAVDFDQNISGWNVGKVIFMQNMFEDATSFNQPISNWNTSKVTNMTGMFDNTHALSNTNKNLIHTAFSSSQHWPYDWSAHAVTLLTGLVAWYPFDGNASDMSGNGNHGTVHGATLGTDRHGRPGKAFSFDGVNDYVDSSNQKASPNAGTMTAWISVNSLQFYNVAVDLGLNNHTIFTYQQSLYFRSGGPQTFVTYPSAPGEWIQVVMSWYGQGNSFKSFVNGNLFATGTAQGANDFGQAGILRIGQSLSGHAYWFNGSIDEVRIYDRALSAHEVEALYQFENTPPAENNNTSPPIENNATIPSTDHNHTFVDHNGTLLDGNVTGPVTDSNTTSPYPVPDLNSNNPRHLPLPRTDGVSKASGGQWRLDGTLLARGGSPYFSTGFVISEHITFQPYFSLPSLPSPGTENFHALAPALEPGKLYYYRAYGRNPHGENFGSIKKFRIPGHALDEWWSPMPDLQAGWRTSAWFGTFRRQGNTKWIYHTELGLAYAVSDGRQGLWLWLQEEGWLWTQPGVFPHLWKHRTGNWLYLMRAVNGKPVFHDYATGSVR